MSYSSSPVLTTFLGGLFAMVFVNVANAEMCKWVDENGCVHYAETCPEGVKSTHVEIQVPPSQKQVTEANKISADMQIQQSEGEEMPSEPAELSTFESEQMTDRCIKARLSLDALSRKAPVYYDKLGQLQAEHYQSVQFDRSSSYLSAEAVERASRLWKRVQKNNCTSAVSGSEVKREIKQQQKEHQKIQCEAWRTELEYMDRNRGFHSKHLELKKIFNANCK